MTFTTLPPPFEAVNPSVLGFEIRAGRVIISHDQCDDLTSWHARLFVPGWISHELWPDLFPPDGDGSEGTPRQMQGRVDDHLVATAMVCTLDLYRQTRLLEILDCASADLAEFIRLVHGDGLRDDLEDTIEGFGTKLVILDRVTVSPQWRGLGLGPLVAALALDTVGADARLFACHPGAFEFEQGTIERDTADKRLVNLWTKFGFTIAEDPLLLADPSLTDWCAVVRDLCGKE